MKKKTILRIILLPLIPLSVPLAAMLFKVDGWAWGVADFMVMWALMAGAGFAYASITRKTVHLTYRIATGLALLAAFMLVWVNGAVGIIGSEENPANLLYGGVLLVGLIGAILARFRAHGMARALFAMALAQLLVPVIALIIRKHDFAPGVLPVFGLNACLALLFVGAALLFRHAARPPHARNVAMTA